MRNHCLSPKRIFEVLLISTSIAMGLTACTREPETAIYIKMDAKIPPSFSFSGPWWASEFKILEMPPKEQDSFKGHNFDKDKKIWSVVDPHPPATAGDWPTIIYGVVPKGFRQEVPQKSSPPELVEGKIYSAHAIDNIGNGGLIYFVIRGGKPIEIPPSEVYYDREAK